MQVAIQLDACQLPEFCATATRVAHVGAAIVFFFVVDDIFDDLGYRVVVELVSLFSMRIGVFATIASSRAPFSL